MTYGIREIYSKPLKYGPFNLLNPYFVNLGQRANTVLESTTNVVLPVYFASSENVCATVLRGNMCVAYDRRSGTRKKTKFRLVPF